MIRPNETNVVYPKVNETLAVLWFGQYNATAADIGVPPKRPNEVRKIRVLNGKTMLITERADGTARADALCAGQGDVCVVHRRGEPRRPAEGRRSRRPRGGGRRRAGGPGARRGRQVPVRVGLREGRGRRVGAGRGLAPPLLVRGRDRRGGGGARRRPRHDARQLRRAARGGRVRPRRCQAEVLRVRRVLAPPERFGCEDAPDLVAKITEEVLAVTSCADLFVFRSSTSCGLCGGSTRRPHGDAPPARPHGVRARSAPMLDALSQARSRLRAGREGKGRRGDPRLKILAHSLTPRPRSAWRTADRPC